MKLASIIKKIKSKIRLITYPLKKLYLRYLLRGKEPIFILGCEHSGTSIMLSILNNHNEIYALTNETGIFSQKYLNLTQKIIFFLLLLKLIQLARDDHNKNLTKLVAT